MAESFFLIGTDPQEIHRYMKSNICLMSYFAKLKEKKIMKMDKFVKKGVCQKNDTLFAGIDFTSI